MPTKTKTTTPKPPTKASPKTMADAARLYGDQLIPFRIGDVQEVEIVKKTKNHILVDVAGYNLGIVPEKEFSFDAPDLKPGNKILASILAMENDAGLVVLSLRRADRERIWQTLQDHFESGEPIKVKVKSANRGGLMVEFGGQEGFLPVSQLSPAHYPKVEGGDQSKILAKLKPMVSQTIEVKIINFDRPTNKLIFSEKATEDDRLAKVAAKFKIGEIVKCEISGIVDFGLFVKIPIDGQVVEGLIHISEISWEKVDKLQEKFKVGLELKAMVIAIDKTKVSLSLKRLEKDPWDEVKKTLAVGTKIKGEITNVTPFGAFVKLPNGLDALLHISQIAKDKKLNEGETYQFYILSIDPKTRKIGLSMTKPDKKDKKSKQ